jgi:hypothetical protein
MLGGVTERASPPSIEEPRGDRSTTLALASGSERAANRMDAGWVGAAIGLIAGGLALGVAHLVASIVNPQASPVITVGQAMIDTAPEWLKTWAIRTFGQNDKAVLVGGICLALAVVALVLGVLSIRRPRVGIIGLAVFAAIGVFAALTRPHGAPLDTVPVFAGFLVGSSAFLLLRRAGWAPVRHGNDPRAFDRRRFLIAGAVGAVVAALARGARATLSAAGSSPTHRGRTSPSRSR